ncbi:hypothetical protein L1765_05065 [Microaerobacter geothermalis]|uniref:hypothetical protein n=1 Tax=Microaerobacter geothermalis TaxID=674972 RepID=UPI001F29003A|nr:hypothetical protein [Microaerobacter geothermalis]MCF6093367.1 hypothetical protein [Microaerobacter geothermalis]
MNISEMLSICDFHDLHRMALQYECECNFHSKNELIQSLLFQVKDNNRLKNQFHDLTTEEISFLYQLIFDTKHSFSYEDILAKAKNSLLNADDKQGYRKMTASFIKRGWLFRLSRGRVGLHFEFPEDIKKRLIMIILDDLKEKCVYRSSPSIIQDERFALYYDWHQLINFIYQQGEIPVTNQGAIYKKYLQQLFQQFSVGEEELQKGDWRFGYGRTFHLYPDRFSLLYDYTYHQGFIEEVPNGLRLTTKGAEAVGHFQDKETFMLSIFHFWQRVYRKAIPMLPMIVTMVILLVKDGWAEEKSLKSILQKWIPPFYYDNADVVFQKRILKMLLHLGIVRRGECNHEPLVGLTTFGQKSYERIFKK